MLDATPDFVPLLVGLAQNVALLLSLTLLYDAIRPHLRHGHPVTRAIVAGVLFGLIAVVGMHFPIELAPGVIADGRVIVIAVAAPFAGVGAAVLAAAFVTLYRVTLGGAGTIAGVGTVATALLLGIAIARYWGPRAQTFAAWRFLVLGLVLDASALAWALALPDVGLARRVLAAAALPVGLFLPLGTVCLGTLLVHTRRQEDERERLVLTQFSIDHSADAIVWIDATGRFVTVNPAAARLTGFPVDTLTAMHLWDVDIDRPRARWLEFWATVRDQRTVVAESRWRRRDGRVLPVEFGASYLARDKREWLSACVRDIVHRKAVEDERTRHLAREQRLRAEAEAANQVKDQFVATISHELRTPLTSILGYARMLQNPEVPREIHRRALETIQRNATLQTQLIDDLLDMSSIVSRKIHLDRRALRLADVVQTALATARPAAEAKALHLEATLDPSVVVAGDGHRLEQVLANLLSNAIKFTAESGRIDVTVRRVGERAQIVVTDTGEGIEPDFLPRVFDRFRQADGSLSRVHGGLGIGLTIVRDLVALHDGTVEAASAGPGHGATFSVNLPVAVPEGAAPTEAETPPPDIPTLAGIRVLLVEDDADTRELLTMLLERGGAHVLAAASAKEALALLEREHPDVLLSDISMPDESGYDLIGKIRALGRERGGGIPAAALTAHARREDRDRALAAGFALHVPKPVEPADLARAVAQLAGREGRELSGTVPTGGGLTFQRRDA